MNLTIKNEIINYCKEDLNFESCGFICYNLNGEVFIKKCKNTSTNKLNNFKISAEEYIRISNSNFIYGIFHSHISESCDFSTNDINLSENMTLPLYMYNTKHKIWKEYLPKSLSFTLLENPFIWGMFDCASLVRNYYWKKFNIFLQDVDRDENIYSNIIDLEELLIKNKFKKLQENDKIQDHDVILFKNYKNLPFHLGILYMGKIYEHRKNRLSEYRKIDQNTHKNIIAVFRHKFLCNL